MIRYLLQGMDMVSNKTVNFDKLHEITQGADENLALFLNCLQKTLTQYTRLDPISPAGASILAGHFISQSIPHIRAKLEKAKDGPQIPIQDLIKTAFKVLMPNKRQQSQPPKTPPTKGGPPNPNLGNSPEAGWITALSQRRNPNLPSAPLGACFKCGKEGHWARQCPNLRPPTKPCPKYKQVSHWESDCPGQGYPLQLLMESQPHQLSRSLTFSDWQKIDNVLTQGSESPLPTQV
jgi:hypothetical protein